MSAQSRSVRFMPPCCFDVGSVWCHPLKSPADAHGTSSPSLPVPVFKAPTSCPINYHAAENGFMGMGVGAAMTGLRPIVEGMNMGFLLLAFNQISNNCGMLHYTSGGQYKTPVVIRGPGGVGRQLGAEHSQRLESYFQSIPGVQLVAVSTTRNAKALLKAVSEMHTAAAANGGSSTRATLSAQLSCPWRNIWQLVHTHRRHVHAYGTSSAYMFHGTISFFTHSSMHVRFCMSMRLHTHLMVEDLLAICCGQLHF